MLHRIARLAIAAPRRILAAALLVMIACGVFGIPVVGQLSAGGFADPTSESARASQILVDRFGQGDMDLLISLRAEGGMDAARTVATDIVSRLSESPNVGEVTSAWTAPPSAASALISADGKTGLIVAGITGGERRPTACRGTHRRAGLRPRRCDRARRRRGHDLRAD